MSEGEGPRVIARSRDASVQHSPAQLQKDTQLVRLMPIEIPGTEIRLRGPFQPAFIEPYLSQSAHRLNPYS